MPINEPEELLTMALGIEQEGERLYRQTASSTDHPLVALLFLELADREAAHKQVFQKLYADLKAQGKLPDKPAIDLETVKKDFRAALSRIFRKRGAKFLGRGTPELLEVYKKAMVAEKRSYEFYDQAAKGSASASLAAVAQAFAYEEKKHYELLEETLTYLDRPADWFREEERWIVEG